MANKALDLRDSSGRIEDGTATTNRFVSFLFREGGGKFPMGHEAGEEKLVINQGKADAFAHRIKVNDEPTWNPVKGSFSGLLYDNRTNLLLLPALSNPFGGTWTVGGVTFAPVTTVGNLINMDGTSVAAVYPVGTARKNLVIFSLLWDGDAADWGLRYPACHFPPEQVEISDDFPSTFAAAFENYGPVEKITAHNTATTEIVS